ncbi:MAG TPA: family 43 glycosylhydrolase [Polyangia bacterium]
MSANFRLLLVRLLVASAVAGCVPEATPDGRDGGAGGGAAGTGGGGAGGATGSAGASGAAGTGGSIAGGAGGGAAGTSNGGAAGTAGGGGSSEDAGAGGGGSGGGLAGRGGSGGGSAGSGGRGGSAGGRGGGSGASGGVSGSGGTTGGGGAVQTGAVIINDRFWKDTSGTPIYSQGGGVLQVGDTYYWYGVKYGGAITYAASPTGKNDDTSFAGITIYSSKNLADWKLENTVKPANTGGWFGRLGVVYHAATQKYVLVAQGGGGLYFATSSTPAGNFVYNNIQTNLPGIVNGSTGDQTMFQDDDGQAYVISSSSSGRANRYVSPLRASDFLAVENAVLVYKGGGREGNCLFKYDGYYYFCSSDLHGWNASQSYCVSAPNIRGPYGAEFVMGGTDRDFSHVTQTGFFVAVKGSAQTTIIFAGDRWSDFAGNGAGYNQWMPLSFSGRTPRMESLTHWSIDAATGAWSVDPRNNYVLNPSFEADRVAMTTPAGWTTSSGSNVQTPHGPGRWSWQLTGTSSLGQTIANLPNGTYTLSAWVRPGSAGAQLAARGFGGTDKTTSLAASTSWTNVGITDIAVSNGQCQVSVTTSGQTVLVDDFVLSRQ